MLDAMHEDETQSGDPGSMDPGIIHLGVDACTVDGP